MHVVFRESHGLEEAAVPTDLGQDPADLVVLSFSDSDLGAFAAGWHRAAGGLPSLRLANLVALAHPLSVDTYVERTLSGAKGILIRLIGGEAYWPYGIASIQDLARRRGIALAVLPADGREDARLDAASTLPVSTLRRLGHLCDQGGAVAAQAALAQLALAAGLYAGPVLGAKAVPEHGFYDPGRGALAALPPATGPRVLVTFYRAYLTAADTEPVDALIAALRARGFDTFGAFAASLKAPASAEWLRGHLAAEPWAAIVNATAFSAKGADGASPLDAAGCPVFQVALSTARRRNWAESARGLSAADLAMHVVLPEVDGRIFAGVASFKAPTRRDPELQFSRFAHRAEPGRIDAIAERVAGWHRLAATPARDRSLALILSTYPGRADQMAHAVGLDALTSAEAILEDLAADGYATGGGPAAPLPEALSSLPGDETRCPGLDPGPRGRSAARRPGSSPGWRCEGADTAADLGLPLADYATALATLPETLRADLAAAWGDPADDPAVADGAFRFAAVRRGNVLVALQPERGETGARVDDYHDLSRVPRHAYVAFYLWLRTERPFAGCPGLDPGPRAPEAGVPQSRSRVGPGTAGSLAAREPAARSDGIHALIHLGAHGTLEWLPGKSVALSAGCWPEALIGPTPVVYPFIVNDPGEAAQAKRRIGSVTLGHAPPPLTASAIPPELLPLEAMLDEYSTADGLDPARRDRLIADIRAEARARGVAEDIGLPEAASAAEAIPRIDRFVCDLKESQFGDGLHVYGRGDTGAGERAGLLAALDGRFVPGGPSGSPWRGRADVLPTGRNLYTTDPRAVPSRAAHAQGVKLAEELLRRHLQDHGDWPRGLVLDLWGSATMRTAGEEFAMALHLAGLGPRWDEGSQRVAGFEILPLALLGRPRIDVTLRVSGLFRDVFPTLAQLFDQAAAALAQRDEAPEDNPYLAPGPRVFGPRPGAYGLGLGAALEDYTAEGRAAAGEAWLSASAWAFDAAGDASPARAALEARVGAAAAFVHAQDLIETDLLLAADYAAHEAGFAAAAATLGGPAPALYHLDATDPDDPRARTLPEEIARVVRARAANPAWADGMARHGFRGAAEIAATLDNLAAFAHLARAVPPHLFDLYHEATLGRPEIVAFMGDANPGALAALRDRFHRLREAGLWVTRRNSIAAAMERGA